MPVIIGNSNVGAAANPDRHGVQYDLFDARIGGTSSIYRNLLASAETSICILDPYVVDDNSHKNNESLFEDITTENIVISIYTITSDLKKLQQFGDDVNSVLEQTLNNYKLYLFGLKHGAGIHHFHDRYLIIDGSRYFMVGQSLDAHVFSNRFHGICELTETSDKELVREIERYYFSEVNATNSRRYSKQKP